MGCISLHWPITRGGPPTGSCTIECVPRRLSDRVQPSGCPAGVYTSFWSRDIVPFRALRSLRAQPSQHPLQFCNSCTVCELTSCTDFMLILSSLEFVDVMHSLRSAVPKASRKLQTAPQCCQPDTKISSLLLRSITAYYSLFGKALHLHGERFMVRQYCSCWTRYVGCCPALNIAIRYTSHPRKTDYTRNNTTTETAS